MDKTEIPAVIEMLDAREDFEIDLQEATFIVGRKTLVVKKRPKTCGAGAKDCTGSSRIMNKAQ